uniref:Dehydrogenase/reductase 2 n=1 Tax=Vombatus ursinus TaxID=29139 RepID=A0A4X2LVS8_VOMUR
TCYPRSSKAPCFNICSQERQNGGVECVEFGVRKILALGPYNVSKTALLGLTRTLSLELAPKGIQVNCLAPGVMKTMFSQVIWKDKNFLQNAMRQRRLTGVGCPEECAGVVSFLCSPDSSYIGETIVVSGFSP